jgi:hypothetical protein
MERDLNLPVKMGTVRGCADVSPTKAAAFASAVGLLNMQRDSYLETSLRFQARGKNNLAKVVDYVTHLYQDYF